MQSTTTRATTTQSPVEPIDFDIPDFEMFEEEFEADFPVISNEPDLGNDDSSIAIPTTNETQIVEFDEPQFQVQNGIILKKTATDEAFAVFSKVLFGFLLNETFTESNIKTKTVAPGVTFPRTIKFDVPAFDIHETILLDEDGNIVSANETRRKNPEISFTEPSFEVGQETVNNDAIGDTVSSVNEIVNATNKSQPKSIPDPVVTSDVTEALPIPEKDIYLTIPNFEVRDIEIHTSTTKNMVLTQAILLKDPDFNADETLIEEGTTSTDSNVVDNIAETVVSTASNTVEILEPSFMGGDTEFNQIIDSVVDLPEVDHSIEETLLENDSEEASVALSEPDLAKEDVLVVLNQTTVRPIQLLEPDFEVQKLLVKQNDTEVIDILEAEQSVETIAIVQQEILQPDQSVVLNETEFTNPGETEIKEILQEFEESDFSVLEVDDVTLKTTGITLESPAFAMDTPTDFVSADANIEDLPDYSDYYDSFYELNEANPTPEATFQTTKEQPSFSELLFDSLTTTLKPDPDDTIVFPEVDQKSELPAVMENKILPAEDQPTEQSFSGILFGALDVSSAVNKPSSSSGSNFSELLFSSLPNMEALDRQPLFKDDDIMNSRNEGRDTLFASSKIKNEEKV